MDNTIALWQHTVAHVIYTEIILDFCESILCGLSEEIGGFKFKGYFPSLSWILLSGSMSC